MPIDVPFSDATSPVADVCRALFDELPALTVRLNAAIARDIGEFAGPLCAFAPDELFRSTRRCTADFLQGVAEARPPSSEEIERRRAIGREGVIRAFPLQPLIGSFHVAYRELWSELVARAIEIGGSAPLLLLDAGARVWEWMHATVNAVADGYDTESARIEALESRATKQFIELIARGDAQDEMRALAQQLGLAADVPVRVLAIAGPAGSVEGARAIAAAVERSGGVAKRAQRGTTSVIIAQRVTRAALDGALRSAPTGHAIGVGTEVVNIDEVRCSLDEAERALDLSLARDRVCYFDEDWFLARATSGSDSIERMLQPGVRVACTYPHLAEAIRVFAESMSMADGARRLRVSHNSFRYRLMRWETLTGWSPWTFDGLARSVVALDVAGYGNGPKPG